MSYPYGPPSYPQAGYGYGGYQQPPAIPAHKGWAIFTLFCGFIFGIAALAKANEVEMAAQRGDFPRAWQASNTAKALCIIGNIFGVLAYAGLVTWMVIVAS